MNFSLQYRPTKWFGVVGDVGSGFGNGLSARTLLFGTQASIPVRFSPFAHFLIGRAWLSRRSLSDASSAREFGGGAELKIGSRIAWRFFQLDYVPRYFNEGRQGDFRFGTALVIRFSSLEDLVPWPLRCCMYLGG
jgi:hypothetical protein